MAAHAAGDLRTGGRTIVLTGVSHHSTPIELRERVHVDEVGLEDALTGLIGAPAIEECVVLSTCNRTEYYLHAIDPEAAIRTAIEAVAARADISADEAAAYVYSKTGYDSVYHLFRVSAGLDSLVVGEAEILGQVGDAYEVGRSLPASVGPVLHRLFQSALAVGGDVRSKTRLGYGAASVPSAAVQLAIKVFGSLAGRTAMVLGAGEMGVATLKCLLAEGVSDVLIANRTLERARLTAASVGARPLSMEGFREALPHVDILVTSTAAAQPIVSKEMLADARRRTNAPLVLLDIALPRDVEPTAGELPSVFLYNIDDLQKVISRAEEARLAEVVPAEELVADHSSRFWRWYLTREVAPLIRGMRSHGENVRRAELERLFSSLDGVSDVDRERIRAATRRLLNKLLHPSTVALRWAAHDPSALAFIDGLSSELGIAEELTDGDPGHENPARPEKDEEAEDVESEEPNEAMS
jgi:glutamyl-tRNA reductase